MARLMLALFVIASMIALFCSGTFGKSSERYPIMVSKNGRSYREQVLVDTKKKTEKFCQGNEMDRCIIYDFLKGLTLIRTPQACYLSKSVLKNIPKPGELQQLLKLMSRNSAVKLTPQSTETLREVRNLTAQEYSGLSDEMQDLCENLPVRLVRKEVVNQSDMDQTDSDPIQLPSKRAKRGCRTHCGVYCQYQCSPFGCHRVCGVQCRLICTWG